ncbi:MULTISPECIES: MerR family transcriptional regulator [Paenibacillus]|uniref:MerR family transcriptional regulator n=1 Tax=Paenibacillus TaxID=44249 RepID=UPI00096CAFBF
MNRSVAINKLSEQMGLTSRTLRHWESEGLFKSSRDTSSGWRIYDENALLCIRITAVLRKMDISIKDIKSVIANKSPSLLPITIPASSRNRNAHSYLPSTGGGHICDS